MKRLILVILAASAVSFVYWQMTRSDPHNGEPALEAQMEAMSADVAATEAIEEPVAPEEYPVPAPVMEEEEISAPTMLTNRVDEIVAAYENAPWVHEGLIGPVLYVISFRTCTSCLAFKEAELHGLEDAGVDVRWIIYTRRDRPDRERSSTEERAVQAELWLNRDWDLFKAWYEVDPDTFYVTTQLPPIAEEEPARMAAVMEARDLVDTLADLYAENGVDLYIPSLLWQQDGQWMTYVGYEEASFAPVRAALVGDH